MQGRFPPLDVVQQTLKIDAEGRRRVGLHAPSALGQDPCGHLGLAAQVVIDADRDLDESLDQILGLGSGGPPDLFEGLVAVEIATVLVERDALAEQFLTPGGRQIGMERPGQ